MSSTVPLGAVQPSQLYLDAAKLRRAADWFDFDDPTYDPIPVLNLGGETVVADGHTRAFLAYLSGAPSLKVIPEPNREEYSMDLYRACVEWCHDEGIRAVPDFAGRVVSHQTFVDEWVARCQASPYYDDGD
ncbi:histone acetyltransferase [Halosegnis sp.]|uniref:histone acetyltransferase n=1 Tax=Halosegnis sp. TaxID=2864959 RepID=UPI0035D4BA1A